MKVHPVHWRVRPSRAPASQNPVHRRGGYPAKCVYKSLGTCKASQGMARNGMALFFCSECVWTAGPATQSFLARRLPAAVGSGGQIKFAAKKRESSAYGVEAFDAKPVSTHWAHWMSKDRHNTSQVSRGKVGRLIIHDDQ